MTFETYGTTRADSQDIRFSGNGSLMRLAPVIMYHFQDARQAISEAEQSSLTTHASPIVLSACRYFGALLHGALSGVSKESLLADRYSPIDGLWEEKPLVPEIDEVACGSFKRKSPPEIRGTGYVVESLEAALWAFHGSESFEEGALMAVNLGDDADTTGAIFGQLAGASYGLSSIPERWLSCLARKDLIDRFAQRLWAKHNQNC